MHSLLIMGNSGSGKTYSLRNYGNDEGFLHINTEGLKTLPFNHAKDRQVTVHNLHEFEQVLERLADRPNIHTVAIDSISYLLNMVEADCMAKFKGFNAWSAYTQYIQNLFQVKLPSLDKSFILTAHTGMDVLEGDIKEFKVKVKGSLKDTGGIESFLTNVVSSQVVSYEMANKFVSEDNPLLQLTEEDEFLKRAYVAFTKPFDYLAKSTVKTPPNVFSIKEVVVSLDAKAIMNRIEEKLN